MTAQRQKAIDVDSIGPDIAKPPAQAGNTNSCTESGSSITPPLQVIGSYYKIILIKQGPSWNSWSFESINSHQWTAVSQIHNQHDPLGKLWSELLTLTTEFMMVPKMLRSTISEWRSKSLKAGTRCSPSSGDMDTIVEEAPET